MSANKGVSSVSAKTRPELVNINVNPCKMCMPMGSATAFYGIRGAMTILHGSQGCSTYIRRHLATHYHEPVDIASSSLTEEGTVFGGEKNLRRGLDNMIKLYDPEVICVATTCLAETIGEDVPRIVQNYRETHPQCHAAIITVPAAGYAGTQFEGYFRALRSLLEQVTPIPTPHNAVNAITGPISPADTRFLRELCAEMGLTAIFLPDISDNLDGGHSEIYRKLPTAGTALSDIARMAGARLTLELAELVPPNLSPGAYLQSEYGVPCHRLPLPMGLRDTDSLMALLTEAGGQNTERLQKQRSRLLDAMADSHKHNAQVRAALFGEPDFVYAAVRLCAENGILPVFATTGSVNPGWEKRLTAETKAVAAYHFQTELFYRDDCDFAALEREAAELGVNVLVGSSDARRLEEKLHIPLVRCAFPIHDYVGGGRIRTLGYEGALTLLDRITNAVIAETNNSFRTKLYSAYF
jgi:nitrogenase molybdenum-iron protein alpha/beta subunit